MTSDVVFDRKEQVDTVTPLLLPSERLQAVFDCKGAGTGFVGITDKRLIFYDKAFIGRKKAITSVPFSRITSVSAIDEGGLITRSSSLAVKAGNDSFEFEFRGNEKAQDAYRLIMTELLQAEA